MLDKLENPNLYEHLKINSTNNLHDKIFHLWVKGIKAEFVTAAEAAKVKGVTEEENQSTSPHFKPGTRYLYPLLKIHKLPKEELVLSINPPATLVTTLQEGISKKKQCFHCRPVLKELETNKICVEIYSRTQTMP